MRYETKPLPSDSINALPIHYILGDYQIIAVLANDSFSITYKATNIVLERSVIIKEYLPKSMALRNKSMPHIILKNIEDAQRYEQALTQYRQETNKLLKLHHPNIANVSASIETNNTSYRVIDFIDAKTLDYYVREEKFSEEDITRLLKPLLHGLQAIHEAGFYHNDLNPTNILIEKNSLRPVIINLGQVKHLFKHQKKDLSAYISIGYSPYEQYVSQSKQSIQTDIYAMGAIFYYLVSGITPNSSAQRLITINQGKQDPLVSACLIAQGYYPISLLLAINHAMESQEINRPKSLQDWKKEFGIKEHSSFTEKTNTTCLPKKLEIDFSVLKNPIPSSIRKTTKRQHDMIVITMTTMMLGTLIVGIASYKPPFNTRVNIEQMSKIQRLKKPSATLTSVLQQKATLAHINLTTISTIIENIYFHYPERKLFSSKEDENSPNKINMPQVLLSKFGKTAYFKKTTNKKQYEW